LQGAKKDPLKVGSSEAGETKKADSVGLRWLTALVLMPVVLLFVWFGGWAAFIASLLVVGLSVYEMDTMLRNVGYRPLTWLSFALCLLFLVAAMFPQHRLILLQIGITLALFLSFFILFFRKDFAGALVDWSLTLAIAIYIGWPMSFFLVLRGYQSSIWHPTSGQWIFLPAGAWWLLVTLLATWVCDGAAFFVGRQLGRHKLAISLSPSKTWEGFIGGLIMAVVASLLLTVWPLGVPWYFSVVLGLLIGVAATLGDLAESLIKRQAHVKDSGHLLPGHGGILDRCDSLFFVVMVVALFVQVYSTYLK
jgi:phosphatidate cytidylyltransferase